MADETVVEEPTTPPDVAEIRDALASQAADKQYAQDFKARNFTTAQEVYAAFGQQNTDTTPVVVPPEEAPELILGKFKDQASLEAAYKALESKLGAPPPETVPPETTPPTAPESSLEIKAAEATASAGLDIEALQAEYAANGVLTPEQYAAFEKGNPALTKDVINGYISQIKEAQDIKAQYAAQVQQATELELKNSVGGPEAYTAMQEWAKTGLTSDQIDAHNAATNSGNRGVIEMALSVLKQRYEAANGSGDTSGFVKGSPSGGPQGLAPFESQAQITAAFDSKEFQTSPSYRAEVRARLAKTNLFG